MYYSIDRFEEEIAVLQDDEGRSVDVPRALLPDGARRGEVLSFDGTAYRPAPDETERRRERIRRLQDTLRRKS